MSNEFTLHRFEVEVSTIDDNDNERVLTTFCTTSLSDDPDNAWCMVHTAEDHSRHFAKQHNVRPDESVGFWVTRA